MLAPPPIELASLGMADSLILMVLALVVFGPRRLPQIGRQIGKLMFEFRKASNDFKFQMEEELRLAEEADRRKREEAERARIAALAEQTSATPAVASTVEAQADIGAIEPAVATAPVSAIGEAEPIGAEAAGSEPVLWPQPPQTGEQVSASEPLPESEVAADVELNADATVSANSIAVAVNPVAEAEGPPAARETSVSGNDPVSGSGDGTSTKEPVNQHG